MSRHLDGSGNAIARSRVVLLAAVFALAACNNRDDTASATSALSNDSPECQAKTPQERLAMLEQIKNGLQINCVVGGDVSCPCGSFCNDFAICATECAPTNLDAPASDDLTCTGGDVCSPDGRCVSAPSDAGPQLQLTLHVAKAKISANTVNGAVTMPVDVSVDANSFAFVVGEHPATVGYQILPTDPTDTSPLPTVQCASDGLPDAHQCEIDGGWQFDVQAHTLHSQPKQIMVTIPQSASAKSWILRAGSEWSVSPTTASVQAIPITFPSTDPGSYAGTVTWTNHGGTGDNQTLSLPIQAVVTTSNVALVEPSRVLLPEGRAVFSRAANQTTMLDWLSATMGGTAAHYRVRMDLSLGTYDPSSGVLGGGFQILDEQGNGGFSGTLTLQRIDDATTCTSDSTCGSDRYCDLVVGACVPGSGPTSGAVIVDVAASTPSASLPSAMVSTWAPTVSSLVAGNAALLGGAGRTAMERAYCFQAANQGQVAAVQYTPASLAFPSEDLPCAYGSVTPYAQLTFPFANLQSETGPDASGDALTLLQNCLTELAVAPTGVLANDMTLDKCVSVGRFFAALAPADDSDTATRLSTQILRQWGGLHAYVANTTVQDQAYDNALNAAVADDATRFGNTVDRVQQDLLVFLDQTVRSHYLAGPTWPFVAVTPDYRWRRPVVRWTFNGTASPVPDVEGNGVALNVVGGNLTQGALVPNGQGVCQSSQPVALDDGITHNRFSVAFVLQGLPTNGTVVLFEKDGPSGDKFWIEGTAVSGGVTIAAKDSTNRSATFPVLSLTTATPTWFFLVDDNGTYRLDVRRNGFPSSSVASSLVGGGPRWGAAGSVMLACGVPTSCSAYNTCTSFDMNVVGDGGDTTYSSHDETAWLNTRSCDCHPTCRGGNGCGGDIGSSTQCQQSASQKRTDLANATPTPPGWVLGQLAVSYSYSVIPFGPEDDGDGGTVSGTYGDCELHETGIPSSHTRSKPVCGCHAGLPYLPSSSYDEVSLWDRPLGVDEEDTMVSKYNYQATSESLAPAAPPPTPPATLRLPGTEQADGLAPQLVEAAAAYAHLLTAYVNASSGTIYGQCYQGNASPMLQTVLGRVGPGLRLSQVLADQAAELAGVPGATSAAWYARYQADARVFAGEVHGTLAALHQVSSCKNPLGIEEGEIPLYIGDASGLAANDRFFAGTRAIVGLIEQAGGELSLAANDLQAAQVAYAAQQQSKFQVDLAGIDRTATFNALHTQYENTLRKYCGVPDSGDLLDRFANHTLTADSCFLATERAGCATAAALTVKDVPASCFRGDMGAHVLAIQTAGIDLDNARHASDRALDQWNGDESYCEARQVFEEGTFELSVSHFQRLETLRALQQDADDTASYIDIALTVVVAVVATVATDGAAAPAAAALIASQASKGSSDKDKTIAILNAAKTINADIAAIVDRGFATDEATENDVYQLELQQRGELQDIADCFHKADADRFAFQQSIDAVRRDLQLAGAAGSAFMDDRDQVRGLVDQFQGQQSLLNTIDRTPPHLHYWLDNAITSYQSHMRNARRLAYLAVRSYEYEAQVTSPQRQAVLAARTPNDLFSAMSALNVASAAYAGQLPNQGSPGQTAEVFSVRDDILDLGGLVAAQTPPGQPSPLSKEAAFTALVASDSSKLYDGDGKFLGHAIRFTLAGNAPWNQDTCAERIWRITPSVQVDGGGPSGPNATHLILYQNNTFGSQVCTDPSHPDVEPGAVSLVRYQPMSNLLTGDSPVAFASADSLSSISIDYFTGKQKPELLGAQQGDSPFGFASGFAGRGIIGSYILLFPACDGCTDIQGWTDHQLAQVTDVLLRFDVVSASNIDNNTSAQGIAQ